MIFQDSQKIVEFMLNFQGLFDVIRVVDPMSRKVVEYFEREPFLQGGHCYDYWKNGVLCANCISSRAFLQEDTFVKIEYNKDKIYMAMASPVILPEHTYVVEMLKDVTETGIVPDMERKTIDEINGIIEMLNLEIVTDELTQVYNRRYINEQLPTELYDAATEGLPLSVIMMDIDHFKAVNDTYGHVCGDEVLKTFSSVIRSVVQEKDGWVARYGGDEFLVVLPNTGPQEANTAAQDLCSALAGREMGCTGRKICATVSVGTYTVMGQALNVEELLARVDQNVYRAKERGRNTVVSD